MQNSTVRYGCILLWAWLPPVMPRVWRLKLTSGPAAVLGASLGRLQGSVGRLAVGGAADLCVFDPNAQWLASAPALRSQGKHTPFSSYEMLGRARCTVVDGQVAFHA